MPDQETLERARPRANHLLPRPANSYGKKSSTCEQASMARDRPSRRSRSVCPRLGAPGSSCRRRDARRRPSKLAERLNRIPGPPQSRISLRESGRERCFRPLNASSGIPHRRARSRDRRIRRQRTELGKIARLRQRKPLGLASATNSYFHILGDKLNGDA
jgi:hypothetical protein